MNQGVRIQPTCTLIAFCGAENLCSGFKLNLYSSESSAQLSLDKFLVNYQENHYNHHIES